MTKCPYDPYAYYDRWGNRYLVFSVMDYLWVARHIEHAELMCYMAR